MPQITPGQLSQAALDTLLDEPLDWRFKGLPSSLWGQSIRDVQERRPDLFGDGFVPPVTVLDDEALTHNLTTIAELCARHGFAHAPHGKTTMAPQLYARQFAHGAWGQTTANASQMRIYRAFGVNRIILANELVDAAALRWLADELASDPEFLFWCWVDSERGVELMTEALGGGSVVNVLVEQGVSGGRTGVRERTAAVKIAEAVAASPALRLAGVASYEGAVSGVASAEGLAAVHAHLSELRDLALDLAGRGHFDGLDEIIVTAGGSAFFDQVVEVLGAPWSLPVLPVLRSGAYITHDEGTYQEISPLGAHPRLDGPRLRPAVRAWAQVVSRPEPRLAFITAGKRDVPYDIDLPQPVLRRRAGTVTRLTGATVTQLNDQHGFVTLDADDTLDVGDWVALGLSHPCTTFDKVPLVPVVGEDGSTVVDLIRTFF
ncbi:amino acid deaminase [Actinophytocola oryzae]|uniref:D-serine deaminase-like pyridoxal phosphate-dependent protein n=1 Tax=Actinophytocola oryzae TaxID=502181 RepID=A0A4R7VZQ3_9PSEU|nr:amino acid deaminase [Actinophytocola oryzae]TDV55265.1 D-serine deaminase-like pyridoxal phosphate-dependent protein [Actinophytocola oryzae]